MTEPRNCSTCGNSRKHNNTGKWCIYSPVTGRHVDGFPICEQEDRGGENYSMWAPIHPPEDPNIGFDPEAYIKSPEVLPEEKPYMGFVLEEEA